MFIFTSVFAYSACSEWRGGGHFLNDADVVTSRRCLRESVVLYEELPLKVTPFLIYHSFYPTPFIPALRIFGSIFFFFPLVLRLPIAGSLVLYTRSSFSSRTFTIFLRPSRRLSSSRCLVDFPPDRLFYLADPLFLLLPAILLRPDASGSSSLTPSPPC